MQASMVVLGQDEDEDTALAYLEDPNLLKILRGVDIEQLDEQAQRRHTKYLRNPLFKPTKMARTNDFCARLCEWNLAIVNYQKAKVNAQLQKGSPMREQVSPNRYNKAP